MKHELTGLETISETQINWHCSCGSFGRATQSWAGDDVSAKARKNHAMHAKRAEGKS